MLHPTLHIFQLCRQALDRFLHFSCFFSFSSCRCNKTPDKSNLRQYRGSSESPVKGYRTSWQERHGGCSEGQLILRSQAAERNGCRCQLPFSSIKPNQETPSTCLDVCFQDDSRSMLSWGLGSGETRQASGVLFGHPLFSQP